MGTKKVRRTMLYAIISMLLLGSFIQYTLSELTNTYVIPSSGQILNVIYAASGSASDIQDAVDLIGSSGGTVYVPAGTFYWNGETVTIPNGGVKIIGASPAGCKGHGDNWESYTPTTILHTNRFGGSMFSFGDQTHGLRTLSPVRISGIRFEADAPASASVEQSPGVAAIYLRQIPDFRVDHCTFINFNDAIKASANDGLSNTDVSCYGLIDHCVVDNPYKLTPDSWVWGYGFYAVGDGHNDWIEDITKFRGKYGFVKGGTIVYIEDNHLSRCRHAFDAMANGYYVARYNLVDNPSCPYPAGMINDHGAAFPSGRGYEAYSNTLVGLPSSVTWQSANNIGVAVRGGSAIITGNSYTDDVSNQYSYFAYLLTADNVVGREEQSVSDTYIWGNSYQNCQFLRADSGINENEDYFLRAPNVVQDGFTYTPYQYPHPLVASSLP